MRRAEALERPGLLVAAAVALQWLTTAVVAARADGVSVGPVEIAQVLLLGPLAVTLAYVVAWTIAGPALGAWTLVVWILAPWVAVALTLPSYDRTLRDDVLPLVLGLEAGAGYPEGTALLAALALALVRTRASVAAAGVLLVGLAVVWATRATPFPEVSWDALEAQSGGLREHFWSQRLLQWLPLAGAVAVARQAPAAAGALLAWLVAYVVLRGAQPGTTFDGGELFRALLPALPAYVVLAAALPLLVPTLAARLGPLATPAARPPAGPAPPGAPAAAPGSSSDPRGAR